METFNLGTTDSDITGFPCDMVIYNKVNDGDEWIKHSMISYNKNVLLDINGNPIDIQVKFPYYKHTLKYKSEENRWYFDSHTIMSGTHSASTTIDIPEDNTVIVPYATYC